MGFVKHQMMREESRGWRDGPNKHVCGECADDEYLAQLIEAEADCDTCDYCGATSPDNAPIAAPVNVLLEAVAATVYHYWIDPAAELSYESAEGGYQGEVIDTREMVADHIGMSWEEELLDDVIASLTNEVWCKRHYARLDPDERLVFGWREFEEITKHQSRFAALLPPIEKDEFSHPDDVPASEMLDEVAHCIHEVGLISQIPAGTRIFRARPHARAKVLHSAAELGAPTPEQAHFANRMSAAGIAVFYGAMDEATAVVETFDPDDGGRDTVTVSQFATLRDLNILNLCDVPPIPSYFDVERAPLRHAHLFVDAFVRAVSRSTIKDGQEHIEYVPTQIFAEYIRHRLRLENGEPVHGILYPSAQVPGGRCCVLFCDQSACLPEARAAWMQHDQWLSLDETSVKVLDHDSCLASRKAIQDLVRAAKGEG